jgi:hypothetical protein
MKSVALFPLLAAAVLATTLFSGCTTLANRRDMYFPQRVDGPYTRMLRDGIPKPAATSGEAPAGSSDFKNVR